MLAHVDDGADDAEFGGDASSKDDLKLDDIQSFVKKLGLPGFSAKTKAKGKEQDQKEEAKEQQQQQIKKKTAKNEEKRKQPA